MPQQNYLPKIARRLLNVKERAVLKAKNASSVACRYNFPYNNI